MSPSDVAALEFARTMSLWGEILVWLGVALEVPEAVSLLMALIEWIKLKRYVSNKPPHPEGNWICGLIAVFGLIVLVAGLSLEIPGHRMEIRITDRENQRLSDELRTAVTQAAEANKLAGAAHERAAKLEATNIELQITLEQFRSNNLAVQKEVAQIANEMDERIITEIEKARFINALKDAPKGPLRLVIHPKGFGFKIFYYLPIYNALKEAGYNFPMNSLEVFTNEPPGIHPKIDVVLYVSSWKDKPSHTDAIEKAFDGISIKPQVQQFGGQLPFTIGTNEVMIYLINPYLRRPL